MTLTVEAQPVEAPDAGVIEEARRRRRRQRALGAATVVAAAAAVALWLGSSGGQPRPPSPVHPLPTVRLSSSLTWLTGPPLAATHLRLVVSENTGAASIVDLDSGHVSAIGGLGMPRHQTPTSPELSPLTAVPSGALAVVTSPPCMHCTTRKTEFLIGADGSVRRAAQLTLTRDQYTTAQVPDSTAAWVLTWPPGGRCTVRLAPSTRPALPVTCGSLGGDTPAGLLVSNGVHVMLIDPQTGRIRERLRVSGPFDVLNADLALESTAPGFPADGASPTDLTLVDLATGARRRLAWPSILHFAYRVLPEPHGSLVAVAFGDPAYTPPNSISPQTIGQALDIWMLDPRSGRFTHVPGFPILEALKFSGIAWTADDRLVIAAQGGALGAGPRTVVGVWRPGQRTLPVRAVPALNGYSTFVPLAG